jgi:hypothetical protein
MIHLANIARDIKDLDLLGWIMIICLLLTAIMALWPYKKDDHEEVAKNTANADRKREVNTEAGLRSKADSDPR